MSEEGKPVGKVGAALMGTVAFGPVLFMVFIVAFPLSWVGFASCSGRQQDLVTSAGSPVLVEEVTLTGEESYLYQVFRVQVLDPQTGKPLKGPWLTKAHHHLGTADGVAWLLEDTPLGISLEDGRRVVDAKLLVAKEPALKGHLRDEERAYHLDGSGRVIIDADDGRRWAVDARLTVLPVQGEPAPPFTSNWLMHNETGPLRFEGSGQRRTLGGAADFLDPGFVWDLETGKPLGTADAWLAVHYERVDHHGMMLSLFGADGAEKWRWKSSRDDESVVRAVQAGGVAVLQTHADGERGLVALELATGKLLWTRGY